MMWNGFIMLSLLGNAMGQRWRLLSGCDTHNRDQIKGAVIEAVTLAQTALNVLNNNFEDEKVQRMVKYILGDDGGLQGKVDRAKELFTNVNKYEKLESFYLSSPFIENTDLLIFCDDSNYVFDEQLNTYTRNKAIGVPIPAAAGLIVRACYSGTPGPGADLPMGITMPSDGVNIAKWEAANDEWARNGFQGARPDMGAYSFHRLDKPNTMDLCTWYLNSMATGGYPNIDDSTIARVQEQTFLDGLNGNDKAIDSLAQSLAGTLLHELTHTTLGGKAVDNPSPNGCYGWVCVGNLHDVNNADSIAHLGVCMYLFTKGFWVDGEGKVQKI